MMRNSLAESQSYMAAALENNAPNVTFFMKLHTYGRYLCHNSQAIQPSGEFNLVHTCAPTSNKLAMYGTPMLPGKVHNCL